MKIKPEKEIKIMTGNLRHINNVMNKKSFSKEKIKRAEEDNSLPLVHESCKCSDFGALVAVGAMLVFAAIILYALVV